MAEFIILPSVSSVLDATVFIPTFICVIRIQLKLKVFETLCIHVHFITTKKCKYTLANNMYSKIQIDTFR